jgi:AcrR family transcriptional regulator
MTTAEPESAPTAPRTARARVRLELTREIKDAARRHLADTGSAGLSLRAVARELGMASSAVYRYFPSRDDLLTALIIDAYAAAGEAAAVAEAAIARTELARRWVATGQGVRTWALANPQEYALIFGSPVPGYRAPADTIDPAARIPILLIAIVADAVAAGREAPERELPSAVLADLTALRALVAPTVGEATLARAMMGWTQLIGSISFELFGHLHNVIHDYAGYFDFQMGEVAAGLGL